MKPEDIAGKTLGGQKGTSQVEQLKAFAAKLSKPVEVKEYVDNNQSYADFAAGRIDASVNSLPNLAYAAQQRSDTFAVVTPPFGQPTYFSWVGRLDDKSLMDAINAAILKVEFNGAMAKIQKTWFGQTMDLPKTVPEPTIYSGRTINSASRPSPSPSPDKVRGSGQALETRCFVSVRGMCVRRLKKPST